MGTRTTYRLLAVESAGFHEGREKVLYQVESDEQLAALLTYKHHNQDDSIHMVSTELVSHAAATAGALPSLEYTAITLALQVRAYRSAGQD